MTRYIRVLLLAAVTILTISCIGITMIAIGTSLPAVKAGIEAQRAQAIADQIAAEAERAEAQAKQTEAQAAIEQAKAAQIEAEGQRAEDQADAYVERELGRAAANAIERQGRLLTLSILSNGLRSFVFGMVAGSAGTFGTIYVLSHRNKKERQLCNAHAADTK